MEFIRPTIFYSLQRQISWTRIFFTVWRFIKLYSPLSFFYYSIFLVQIWYAKNFTFEVQYYYTYTVCHNCYNLVYVKSTKSFHTSEFSSGKDTSNTWLGIPVKWKLQAWVGFLDDALTFGINVQSNKLLLKLVY
jgi:hypothetical protein